MAPEPTIIPITIRKLKPGTYADWRKAWHDPADPDLDGANEVIEVVTREDALGPRG